MAPNETESAFIRRLAAAVRAAWWTFLIGVLLAIVQFFAYAAVSHTNFLVDLAPLMGLADFGGDALRLLILGFMLAIRVVLMAWFLGTLFLTLWLRRLRRMGGE